MREAVSSPFLFFLPFWIKSLASLMATKLKKIYIFQTPL